MVAISEFCRLRTLPSTRIRNEQEPHTRHTTGTVDGMRLTKARAAREAGSKTRNDLPAGGFDADRLLDRQRTICKLVSPLPAGRSRLATWLRHAARHYFSHKIPTTPSASATLGHLDANSRAAPSQPSDTAAEPSGAYFQVDHAKACQHGAQPSTPRMLMGLRRMHDRTQPRTLKKIVDCIRSLGLYSSICLSKRSTWIEHFRRWPTGAGAPWWNGSR